MSKIKDLIIEINSLIHENFSDQNISLITGVDIDIIERLRIDYNYNQWLCDQPVPILQDILVQALKGNK